MTTSYLGHHKLVMSREKIGDIGSRLQQSKVKESKLKNNSVSRKEHNFFL